MGADNFLVFSRRVIPGDRQRRLLEYPGVKPDFRGHANSTVFRSECWTVSFVQKRSRWTISLDRHPPKDQLESVSVPDSAERGKAVSVTG